MSHHSRPKDCLDRFDRITGVSTHSFTLLIFSLHWLAPAHKDGQSKVKEGSSFKMSDTVAVINSVLSLCYIMYKIVRE